ncbi:amidase signature enzyme [Amylostereum chailletii]|nr:amidase signature enzyme [Amylostereum chailletii]
MLSCFTHNRACRMKQKERHERIRNLPEECHSPLTDNELHIIAQQSSSIVADVQAGRLEPREVLVAYGKKAIKAQRETNCLTEIMIAEAEEWAKSCNKTGPLAGMPVSLKDMVCVAGFDSTAGYSVWAGNPATKNSPLFELLLDAGAIPFVKTNVPITLLAYEAFNDVWGRTTNPHSSAYSPGGSSGGEAALLAFGGSRLGIGTDVAGSVRVPSHYSGVYTIKASSTRFPKAGNVTSTIGQEGVPSAYSPMTRTLGDLETFWGAVMSMKPWEYDPSCSPIPWRAVQLPKKCRIGVMWNDGVVAPSPACLRALNEVVDALRDDGHEIFTIDPPSPFEALKIGSQLMANACIGATSRLRWGESNDPGIASGLRAFHFPRLLTSLYAWFTRTILGDPLYASLISSWRPQTPQEFYHRIADREAYRMRWHEFWKDQKDEDGREMDFVLTVPNAMPAMPHGDSKNQWTSCGYAFLFNILDYSAGVLPVTHVDRADDVLPSAFKPRNAVEAGAYKTYNSDAMHGLPVGVQVVGRRLEEEKVLEGMKLVEGLLRARGTAYELL